MEDQSQFEKRVGTTLRGKWTLERLLGVGGMAAVYVGVHKIGRRDAIKILHPAIARSKDLRDRFEQEAHAVNLFKHPGAVEIRDIDTSEDGAPFLVMELLEGESLSERARRLNGIETGEMLRLIDELLDVLASAHAMGIVHRDIKLDNLFVQKDGRLKVLDFGIARMRTGSGKALLTRTGATLGTVAYMPPEQVKGTDIDHRADLFAVGATMYRLVAKRRIHEAKNESDLLVKMATEPAASLASVAAGAPKDLCIVVDRALAFHRTRRYPDATTMQTDVRALRSGSPPPYATARLAEGDLPGARDAPAGADPLSVSAFGAPSAFRDAATAATRGPSVVHSPVPGSIDPTAATSPDGGAGLAASGRAGHELALDTPPPPGRRTAPTDPTVAPGTGRTASAPNLQALRDAPTITGAPTARTASGQHAAVGPTSLTDPGAHLTPPPPSIPNPPLIGSPVSTPLGGMGPSTAQSGPPSLGSTLKSHATSPMTAPFGAGPTSVGPASFGGHSPTAPSAAFPAHRSDPPVSPGVVGVTSAGPMSAAAPSMALSSAVARRKRESATPLIVMGVLFLVCGIGVGLWLGLRGGGDAASAEAAASAVAPPGDPPTDPQAPSGATGPNGKPVIKLRLPGEPTGAAAAGTPQAPSPAPAPRATGQAPATGGAPTRPPPATPPPSPGKGKDKGKGHGRD